MTQAESGMAQVYVGIGSNLQPEINLRLAIAELRACYGTLTCSPVYRNAAVGFAGDDFLNMVAGFRSDASPQEIVAVIERIHSLAGRARGCARMVSRTLDIDLLLYDELVLEQPPLPRDDVLEYLFVLQPLVDIAPGFRYPQSGKTLAEHLQAYDGAGHSLERVDMEFPGQ